MNNTHNANTLVNIENDCENQSDHVIIRIAQTTKTTKTTTKTKTPNNQNSSIHGKMTRLSQ